MKTRLAAVIFLMFTCMAQAQAPLQAQLQSWPTEFVLVNDRIVLVAPSAELLTSECLSLQKYVEHYSRSNYLSVRLGPGQCRQVQVFQPGTIRKIVMPRYYDREVALANLMKETGFMIDVNDWLPTELWAGYEAELPHDGVCYDTALIDSGILPRQYRTQFLQMGIRFFLGLQGEQQAELPSPSYDQYVGHFGYLSASPLVKERVRWSISEATPDVLSAQVHNYVREHFTPGSLLCIDKWSRTKGELLQNPLAGPPPPNMKFTTNLAQLPDDFYSEKVSDHCAVLMTPDLIAQQGNYTAPTELIDFDAFFANRFIRENPPITTLHYFRIDSAAVESRDWMLPWTRSREWKTLMKLAAEHKALVDSNPSDLKSQLVDFWKNQAGPVLDQLKQEGIEELRVRNLPPGFIVYSKDSSFRMVLQDLYSNMRNEQSTGEGVASSTTNLTTTAAVAH